MPVNVTEPDTLGSPGSEKPQGRWFGAKCLFVHRGLSVEEDSRTLTYEERVVLVKALDFNWAIRKAERDATAYASKAGDCKYLKFVDCFDILENEVAEFTEVYSLMRKSNLDPDRYVSQFYATGEECTTESNDSDCGIDAEVTAIGPFAPEIAPFLDQDETLYKNTIPGKSVIVGSVFWSNGKRESLTLAECLGIGLLDFNRHALDTDAVNLFMLNREFGKEDTARYVALRNHGFQFFYMPHIANPVLLEDL